MNDQLKAELEHLMRLMAPPFTANWKAYSWRKAKELAARDPAVFAGLPDLLTQRMKETSK